MNTNSYPSKKIIAIFTLLGGIVGGVIALIFGYLIAFLMGEKFNFHFDLYLFKQLLGGAFGSFITGLVPMFFISLKVVNNNFYLKNYISYIKLFIIGFSVTALLATLVVFVLFPFLPKDTDQIFAFLNVIGSSGLLGGASSIILGHFTLPKKENLT